MLDSLAGSKEVMIGLMVRPLMPPEWLIWSTNRSMAFTCSVYSTSPANPYVLLSAWRLTTGNATLMVWAVTPRALVLAWVTGVTADEAAAAGTTRRTWRT